jgi:succinoglycan biosynthesis protein ExoA
VTGSPARGDLPALPDPARVSVVLPARGAETTLPAAVAAARQGPVTEVVVAVPPEDAATWRVAGELAADHAEVRRVANPGGRTPDGLNAAIAASTGDVIVRVDAHAVLPAGYVERAVATLRATGAANVGGRQVPTAEAGVAAGIAAAMASPAGAGGATYRVGGDAGPVETVYLGVFRRDVLTAVGGFDPRFTRNQDYELNQRLREAGYTVWFDPELAVAYRPRASLGALARQYLDYGRWRRVTARVHPGSLKLRQVAPPVLVVGLATSVVVGAAVAATGRRVGWAVPGTALGGYLTGVVAAAGAAAPGPAAVPATAGALATMHLAWGVGFLMGPPRGEGSPPRHRTLGDHV